MAIDLHVHSCYSDGTLTPAELVRMAVEKKIKTIALTDHDTVDGIAQAEKESQSCDIRFIPGIEISCLYCGRKEMHILGYCVDTEAEEFNRILKDFREIRNERNAKMIRLIKNAGLYLDEEELYAMYSDSVITRAHFAEYLYRKKEVSSVADAFDRYLGDGKKCFVPKTGITCRQAVECILKGKGHPVLAHPLLYRMGDTTLDNAVRELKECGLEGLEAVYVTNTPSQNEQMKRLAGKYKLNITGGSDFHGSKKPDISLGSGRGNLCVPDELADWLT